MAIDTDKYGRVLAISQTIKSWLADAPAYLQWLQEKFPWRFRFKSLTSRLFVFNLIGVLVLIIGVFYFSQTRKWLIQDATQNLRTQGEIIAAAIARNANAGHVAVNLDADQLLESDIAGNRNFDDGQFTGLEFPIKPQLIAPIFKQLVRPTNTRARIYSLDGTLILDSDTLLSRGRISREDLPPLSETNSTSLWDNSQKYIDQFSAWFRGVQLPLYKEIGDGNGNAYSEVRLAINGDSTPMLMLNEQGQHIVSIGVPVRRIKAVLGALQLTTRGGDIDRRIADERWTYVVLASAAILATILSTMLLAGTIAQPMKKLSAAANHVRRSIRARTEIPEMPGRLDEIGQLSAAFGDMTQALYRRIEASEKFAADVAHELKNPLTSVRSAAQTLKGAKSESVRQELIETIENDVSRLDRLITDIAKSSRLDAELAMGDLTALDIGEMLASIIGVFNDIHEDKDVEIKLDLKTIPLGSSEYTVLGHQDRLAQVLNNLIDNAVSFSPAGTSVWVRAGRMGKEIIVRIEDEGPGIPPKNIEKIFNRFYTDRPDPDAFGMNSGLGLSISRDIIAAHKGKIWAENRYAKATDERDHNDNSKVGDISVSNANDVLSENHKILGARFVIALPVEKASSRGAG